jgi:hypothetical protein
MDKRNAIGNNKSMDVVDFHLISASLTKYALI